ncbi:hypothetical protein [Mucilaginibacter myungsuensis]|uniref:Uncharacterized protein n=1 Tax=Mucilaginibacter myungsuensis TaxID=649104 RepID=A0A929PY31_9SPHI|nr:hypothetical protein [Mucilaginibacter myungsuensis]MBE9662902.1 hypothetical protein [Mucilaginibacter myungsuensis]MDN3598522.1 hypothetical protein [Mucilaginibacter myungsuensis]
MPTQPYHSLLQVFYFGLVRGIVTKQEISAWADSIIIAQEEPEYFFIELSIATDINELFTAINSVGDTALTPLSARAVLGLIWHRLEAGAIDIEEAISLCSTLTSLDVLTWAETSEIYEFECDLYPYIFIDEESDEIRRESGIRFLSSYAAFSLDNYPEWEEIHTRISRTLADVEADHQLRLAERRVEQEQEHIASERKTKAFSVISYSLGAVTFFFAAIGPSLLASEQTPSNLFIFIWIASALYFMFFVCYHIVLAIRFVLRKLFPDYF